MTDLGLPPALVVAHVALTAAVGLGVLTVGWKDRRPTLATATRERTLAMLLTAATTGVASAISSTRWGVDFFGIIHLWFADILIAGAILGVAQVALARQRGGLPLMAGVGLLAGSGCAAWGHFVEPFWLELERPSVVAGELRKPLRIGILTDLQTAAVTAYEENAVTRLLVESPDLIVVPGDLFQGPTNAFEEELPRLRALLGRLRAPLGVYAVIGNTDQPREFARVLEGTGVVWLHNQIVEVASDFGTIAIAGVGFAYQPEVADTYRKIADHTGGDRLTVVIAHDPGVLWRRGIEHRGNIVLAGHTHGGQVRLPLIGSLLTLSRLPRRYAAGLHRWQDSWLYVSRGVGVERAQAPRIRFLCRPEITLLTIQPLAAP